MEDSGLDMNDQPEWLSSLLQCDQFYASCSDHQELRKSEKTFFCIDCNLERCIYCTADCSQHRWLQIYKYGDQNVVSVQEIQKLFDCSRIQTNKIKGGKVVHLKPKPQARDAKPSIKSKTGAPCKRCGINLKDPLNRFCSIVCKVSAADVNPEDQNNEMELPTQELLDLFRKDNQNSEESTEEKQSTVSSTDASVSVPEETKTVENKSFRPKHRNRKGIPSRAPLF